MEHKSDMSGYLKSTEYNISVIFNRLLTFNSMYPSPTLFLSLFLSPNNTFKKIIQVNWYSICPLPSKAKLHN